MINTEELSLEFSDTFVFTTAYASPVTDPLILSDFLQKNKLGLAYWYFNSNTFLVYNNEIERGRLFVVRKFKKIVSSFKCYCFFTPYQILKTIYEVTSNFSLFESSLVMKSYVFNIDLHLEMTGIAVLNNDLLVLACNPFDYTSLENFVRLSMIFDFDIEYHIKDGSIIEQAEALIEYFKWKYRISR